MSVISIRHHRGSLVPVSTHYMKNDIFKPRGGGGSPRLRFLRTQQLLQGNRQLDRYKVRGYIE